MVSDFVAANFSKKESRSPRGFLPRPLLRAGETAFRTPPPFPQTKEAGLASLLKILLKKCSNINQKTPHLWTSVFSLPLL